MELLHNLHSFDRWLIAAVALAVTVKLALNVFGKQDFTSRDAMLVRIYTTLLTIQFTLGIILLVNAGNQVGWDMSVMRLQLEHVFTMIIALSLAHATTAFRRSPASRRSRKTLLFVVLSLVLIVAGVARLKGIGYWWGV